MLYVNKWFKLLQNSVILLIPMIVLEKSHQNLSVHIQFLFKRIFNATEKQIFSSGKMRNSGNYIYNYAHRSPEKIFNPMRCAGKIYTGL